MLELML